MQRFQQPKKQKANIEQPEGLPVPPERTAPMFVFVHYPTRWEWVDGEDETGERYGWLPNPAKVLGVAGANGNTHRGYGHGPMRLEHMQQTLAVKQQQGGIVIWPHMEELGPFQGYDEYYDTRDGMKHFVEPGEEALVLGGRVIWDHDGDGPRQVRRAFQRQLATFLPPLVREIFRGFMNREETKLSHFVQVAANNPGLAHKVEKQEAKMAAMREDFERQYGDKSAPDLSKATKPAKRRSPRKTPEASP